MGISKSGQHSIVILTDSARDKVTFLTGAEIEYVPPSQSIGAVRLEELDLPKLIMIGARAFKDSPIIKLVAPVLKIIDDLGLSAAKLTSLQTRSLEYIGTDGMRSSKLTVLDQPNLKYIGARGLYESPIVKFNAPNLEIIGENAFNGARIETLKLYKATEIGMGAFESSPLTYIYAGLAQKIGRYAFHRAVNRPSTRVILDKKFDNVADKDRIFGRGH